MKNPVDNFWKIRLAVVKDALEENGFETYVAQTPADAQKIVIHELIEKINPQTVSWGGSMTFTDTGIYQAVCDNPSLTVLDTFDKSLSREAAYERRRQALLVDLFITGTNAVTENGKLINLDMIGNRVGAITFGPKQVIILVGRNKIVGDIEEGIARIKNFVAPANAMRLEKKTPCLKTACCEECCSPDRICNTWSIVEKSFPKGRIKVVLINADLGL